MGKRTLMREAREAPDVGVTSLADGTPRIARVRYAPTLDAGAVWEWGSTLTLCRTGLTSEGRP
jgi:hypothetical protein